jgi:hypothetical protein
MKRVIYAGAFLMIGAAVYGFVDFRKASREAAFRSIYTDDAGKKVESVIAPSEESVGASMIVVASEEKKAPAKVKAEGETKQEVRKKKKRVEMEKFSRAALAEEFEPVKE